MKGEKIKSFADLLHNTYGINMSILDLLGIAEQDCREYLLSLEEIAAYNQLKVLRSFQNNHVTDFHLHGSTGYGYGDIGRDTLERLYADIFCSEDALVRMQIVSGTHAISLALLGVLQRGDELLSATGRPYDTLQKVIGLKGEYGSLLQGGIHYTEIDLDEDGKIDLDKILDKVSNRTRMLLFQRSKGYEWRPSFSIAELEQAISVVKAHHPDLICVVDNCYGEFVETKEPTEAGADLLAGSLIKNPGGGLALTGGYLAGKKELIEKAASRLAAPGIGSAVGASLNFNRTAFQGFFMAPAIVGEALQGAVLASRFFELLGYRVLPTYRQARTDIIQAIRLGSRDLMRAFCRGIQKACPLDARATPEPGQLPGYEHEVIMAGGTFIQGSSIELSADGPVRPPYDIFLQGGLSFYHIKIGLAFAAQEMLGTTKTGEIIKG